MNAPNTCLALLASALLVTPASAALVTISNPGIEFSNAQGWMGITPPALFTTGDVLSYSFTFDTTATATVRDPAFDPNQKSLFFNGTDTLSTGIPIVSASITVSRDGTPVYQANVSQSPTITLNQLTYSYHPTNGTMFYIEFGETHMGTADPTIPDTSYAGDALWIHKFNFSFVNPSATTTPFDLTPGNSFSLGELLGDGTTPYPYLGATINAMPGNGAPTPYTYNFYQTAVPEPSVALLGAIGILGLLRRRR